VKDSQFCPEDVVARARHGIDAIRKDERLSSHLQQCASCRRELAIARAFKDEFVAYSGADDLARRVAAAIGKEPAPRRVAVQRRKAGWTMLAAAVILVSLAAYAWDSASRGPWYGPSAPAAPSPPVTPPTLDSATSGHGDELAPPPPPVDTVLDTPAAIPAPAPRPTSTKRAVVGPSDNLPPSARDLFSSANAARRTNDGSRASALYRELQQRYPTSSEALVSRVSFGRVLLEQLGDPAGALVQFDGYLSQTAHTALAEEALFGRATALSRLGRLDAERETWRTLLARYPFSTYAERARVRLGGIK
jgi:hypothetical protein